MEVLGDNIQRDEAKRNQAEWEANRRSAGGKMGGMAALRISVDD